MLSLIKEIRYHRNVAHKNRLNRSFTPFTKCSSKKLHDSVVIFKSKFHLQDRSWTPFVQIEQWFIKIDVQNCSISHFSWLTNSKSSGFIERTHIDSVLWPPYSKRIRHSNPHYFWLNYYNFEKNSHFLFLHLFVDVKLYFLHKKWKRL